MKILLLALTVLYSAYGQLQVGGFTAAANSAYDFTAATTFKIPNLSTGGNPGAVPYICNTANFTFCEDTTVGPFVDATNHRVGVGTNAPANLFTVESTTGGFLENVIADSGFSAITATSYRNSATTHALFFADAARGTKSSPLALNAGDNAFSLRADGWDTTGFNTDMGDVSIGADENFTTSAQGGFIKFSTQAKGSTAGFVTRLYIGSQDNISLGTNNTSPAANTISILDLLGGSTTTSLYIGSDNNGHVSDTTRTNFVRGASDTGKTNTIITNASMSLNDVSAGFTFKAGANARTGTGTLSGGTLAVTNTSITANSQVFVMDTGGGTLANIGSLYIASQTATTGFTVTSTNVLDNSTFRYWIFETN